jgi:hypothetical protein
MSHIFLDQTDFMYLINILQKNKLKFIVVIIIEHSYHNHKHVRMYTTYFSTLQFN